MGRLFSIWHAIWRHKYAVTGVLFLLLLIFFDDDNLMARRERRAVISDLRTEITRYANMYDRETRELEALRRDPAAVERLARERYLMHRPSEEIYVVE